MKTRDGSGESTNLTTIISGNCGFPPGLNQRQKPAQSYPADNEHTMNAAERFLESFLRNTSDEQAPESKENEKEAMSRSPPRILRQDVESSRLQSAGLEYQARRIEYSPRPAIGSRYNSEFGAHFDRSREYRRGIAPLPLNTAQYHHRPSKSRDIAPINGSVSRYSPAGTQKNDSRGRSPNPNKDCNQYHRQPSIHLMEKYNNHSYTRKDDTYFDPPPFVNDHCHIKDTYWSQPVVYPVPPLPPVLPTPGYYDSQYRIDYRGPTRSGDLLPRRPHSPAQYSRYLPPRSLVPEAAYRRRSRSPPVITRSSEHTAMPYTSVSAPPREYGTMEDHRKMNGGVYHQPRGDRREPSSFVWQGRGRGNGRGGGTRGAKMNSGR